MRFWRYIKDTIINNDSHRLKNNNNSLETEATIANQESTNVDESIVNNAHNESSSKEISLSKEKEISIYDDIDSKNFENDDSQLETECQENSSSSSTDLDSPVEENKNYQDAGSELENPINLDANNFHNDQAQNLESSNQEFTRNAEDNQNNDVFSIMNSIDALSKLDSDNNLKGEVVEGQDISSSSIKIDKTMNEINNSSEKIETYTLKTSFNSKSKDNNLDNENNLRLELLKRLRDFLVEYAEQEETKPERNLQQIEAQTYQLNEDTNQFIDKLNELPSFVERVKSPGYAIDTTSYTEVSDSIIRTLITKFLNQRFCKMDSNLNVRSNSMEKGAGFYKWETKDMIVHLETEQLTKIPNDKYDYQYADSDTERVPLSFYFDMSGSMVNYTNMLAVMIVEILKKKVKVLIGYNEEVCVQIDSIAKNIGIKELADFLTAYEANEDLQQKIKYKDINEDIDVFLINAKAEKCCIFSDFDPRIEIMNLSHKVQVYWFCFENQYDFEDLDNYHGFIYPVKDMETIAAGLSKVNENRFETLVYVNNQKLNK